MEGLYFIARLTSLFHSNLLSFFFSLVFLQLMLIKYCIKESIIIKLNAIQNEKSIKMRIHSCYLIIIIKYSSI